MTTSLHDQDVRELAWLRRQVSALRHRIAKLKRLRRRDRVLLRKFGCPVNRRVTP